MQRIPNSMLQALQRGGEEKEARGRTQGGETAEEERPPGQATSSQARQSTVSFTSNSPYASPTSSSSPLDSEASRYPRLSRSQIPTGGRGGLGIRAGESAGAGKDAIRPEAPIEDSPLERSAAGPRALGAPQWPSTAETIPSQLLGGSVEAHANVLASDSTDFTIPLAERESSKQQSRGAEPFPALLSANWSQEHTTPNSPASSASSSSTATHSKSSRKSYASSYAYLLRDHRNDLRLFKKSSRPSQHLRKSPALVKPPPPGLRRSSSYYKPKVVEDNAALIVPSPSKQSPVPSPGSKPPPPTLSPPRSTIRLGSPGSHSTDSSPTRHRHPSLSPGSIAKRRYRSDTPPAISASASPSPSPRPPREAVMEHSRSRRRSSLFGILRHPGATHHIFHGHKGEADLPTSPTPDITVSSPQLAKLRRRSTITSYFSRPRLRSQQSSDATPSPAISGSGLSTNWEDVIAETQPAGHAKEISEPMSPLTLPQLAKRPQPTPVQDRDQVRELPEEAIVPVVPSGPVAGPQPKYKSASGEEFYEVSLSGPHALSFLPSEMKRVNTPPESKKPKGFKGFFFDMRSMPSESGEMEPESPEPRTIKRRTPIFQTRSMQSLVQKLSMPKLKRKASEAINKVKEPDDPLAVTGFEQTPYSQRYGDARRAKMSQIRSYMDDALKEDDDDEGSAYPFVFSVPDHLPNSPLCPLSLKHSSGGKAICPIHGRKRATFQIQSRPTRRQEPKIVFESSL